VQQIVRLLEEIAKVQEVCKRRSDPKFNDLNRYVVDLLYILNTLREKNKVICTKIKILDVSAGAGVFSIALATLGFEVTATNLVVEELPEKRFFKQFGCDFRSINLDTQTFPFSSDEFDVVLFLHVIEHLKKPLLALKEIRRVLKPGGTLIIATPNGAVTSIYKRLPRGMVIQDTDHFKEYTFNELALLFKHSGFNVSNVAYSNEMVSASLRDIAGLKRLLVQSYCLFCNVIPVLRYEIHMTGDCV
jgi:2-polyprenyl-3-methyl-5-hydroxy-6-metoxy-1,4-benzoquinol methylase